MKNKLEKLVEECIDTLEDNSTSMGDRVDDALELLGEMESTLCLGDVFVLTVEDYHDQDIVECIKDAYRAGRKVELYEALQKFKLC